ncbi:hypothetical protein J2X06_002516 [Lysobacter niastensis]|uniref:Uncharacterized protein n=1 Tax=Lysobacter niastensis TaxID=380629 RepID=A0ABU1WCP3_9GAMM|nr:hypothetical protein [Lysobacter niastensis]MDR7135307.1 hypothetical protein [Lysobacter niastensis]
MFASKSQRVRKTIGITLAGDLEALDGTIRAILNTVPPCDAWLYLQPHTDRVLERAGGLWPLAEEEIAEMLAKHGVTRSG